MSRLAALVVLTALVLAAFAAPALAVEVTITDDGFSPERVQAGVGETVTWLNDTDADVTISSDEPRWSSGPIAVGDTFSLAFDEAGTFDYASVEGSHEGQVVVDEEGEEPAGDGGDAAGESQLPDTGSDVGGLLALSLLLGVVGVTAVKVADAR